MKKQNERDVDMAGGVTTPQEDDQGAGGEFEDMIEEMDVLDHAMQADFDDCNQGFIGDFA